MSSLAGHRWIAGPKQDLLLLIGLPLLIIPVVAMFLTSGLTDERSLNAWVFALGAQGHHLPGWLRAYGDRDVFAAHRRRLIGGPVMIIALALVFALADLTVLILAAYVWGIWHGLMQTYGVARIYGRFQGASEWVARWDLIVCQVGFVGGVIASPLRQHYLLDFALRLGLPIPASATLEGLRVVAILAVVTVGAIWLVIQWQQGLKGVHPGRLLLIPSSIAFWWFCNLTVTHMLVGLALFEIFHDLQYLSLVWWVGRTRLDQGAGGHSAAWLYGRGLGSVALYVAACMLYGAMGAPGEAGSDLHRLGIGLLAASQLLHFYFDGFIWRLSRPENATWVERSSDRKPHGMKAAPWGVIAALCVLAFATQREIATRSQLEDRILRLAESIPSSPILQTQLAAWHRQQLRPVESIESYRRALTLIPDYDLARAGIAAVFDDVLLQGSLDQARDEDCLALDRPDLALRAFETGKRALMNDQHSRAVRFWRTAACLNLKDAMPFHSLAVYYGQRGELNEAKSALRRGLRYQPQSKPLKDLLDAITSRRD